MAFVPHGALIATDAWRAPAADNARSEWSAYARTTAGLHFAPYNQINRDNVSQLKPVWTLRTGDTGPGDDQNTPLQIGNTLYSCTRNNRIIAIDADSGQPRWKFDPKVNAPMWQRCRGLGFYRSPDKAADAAAVVPEAGINADATKAAPTPAICRERIIQTTLDARLIALDAGTGQPCPGFGQNGMVDLQAGMGPVKPGFYFQTSAPLVARDRVVVGGWVLDNRERGEPSGVIRAFDVNTDALLWAWDLGNPAITALPPEGQTYTRGTPNMWTTAAYDDALGLVYVPLGNATPDYFGMGRPPGAEDYNASLVALDITTGRERWKFQTVHHDIWDYDLASQPALVDLADGTPAVLQATKRGQLFLLNRATGVLLAEVAEKPVPQNGAVPEERLSPTQPYSVGMPTIGAMRLDETKMWGMTLFDQLICRIQFRQLRYDGDFTPIGLQRAIQQPGNLGGLNWGSVSVDSHNQMAYVTDIRIPSRYRLIPRNRFNDPAAKDSNGHSGASPQLGTPYAADSFMWMSPLGVPCAQPPYGTLTAVDLATRKIAWQVPAGTAEQLGPLGIRLHLPMPIGMPTYGGNIVTAGGLVFFAGTQDYYLRAYDAATGRELWKHPLPVGSSATPMTYISPQTGRQYIVVSAGGAAYSREVGDYVIAFALDPAKPQ